MRMVPQVWAFPPSILVGSPSISANCTQLLFNQLWSLENVAERDGQWWSKVLVPFQKPRNMNPVVLSLFAALFTNDLLDLKARQEQRWDLAYAYAALDTLPHKIQAVDLSFPLHEFCKGSLGQHGFQPQENIKLNDPKEPGTSLPDYSAVMLRSLAVFLGMIQAMVGRSWHFGMEGCGVATAGHGAREQATICFGDDHWVHDRHCAGWDVPLLVTRMCFRLVYIWPTFPLWHHFYVFDWRFPGLHFLSGKGPAL